MDSPWRAGHHAMSLEMTHQRPAVKPPSDHDRVVAAVLRRGLAPSPVTPSLSALLHAVTANTSERILEAYRAWSTIGDLNEVETREEVLLPLLAARLARLDVQDERAQQLRAVRRQVAVHNQKLATLALDAIERLDRANVDVLAVKGFAVCPRYHGDFNARRMADVDLLVPEHQVTDALGALESRGDLWPVLDLAPDTRRLVHHGINLQATENLGVDLHWHLLYEACYPGADQPFWDAAEQVDVHGKQIRTLCHADAFLLAVCHGARGDDDSLIRWIPDAMAILHTAQSDFDWDRLVAQAERLRVVPILEAAAGWLVDTLDAPIPAPVLRRLADAKLSRTDVRHFEQLVQRRRGPIATPRSYWTDFWMRIGHGYGVLRALPRFPTYVAYRLGIAPGALPAELWRRANQKPARGTKTKGASPS